MNHVLRLHEFFVEGKNQQKSHVLLHITEPATETEKQKGYFFAVCEINNGDINKILKLQEIIDQIENEYYEISAGDNNDIFEATLNKVNPAGFSLLKNDLVLNCLVGVIKQAEIIFSFYGQPVLALFYKNKQGLYQKLDLIESNQEEENTTLFSQVIQGKISPEDHLFVGTPHILDYFNLDRIEKIITTRPARQSAEHLERVLTELKNGYSFGGLIINLHPQDETTGNRAKILPPQEGSAKSLNNFFDTEKQTADILSPSVMPKMGSKLKSFFHSAKNSSTSNTNISIKQQPAEIQSTHLRPHRSNRNNTDTQNTIANLKIYTKKSAVLIGQGLIWIIMAVWTIVWQFINLIGLIFLIITNIQNRRQMILENWRRGWNGYKNNLKQLPLTTKILLGSSAIVALIFISSIIYLRHQQSQKANQQMFNSYLEQITAKKDAAESALIYNDENAALIQIQAANQLLNELDCKNKDNQNDCEKIKDSLEQLAIKLRKITIVNPQILFDWSSEIEKQKLTAFLKLGTKIIAYSPNTSSLFIYDALTKNNKVLPINIIGTAGLEAAAVPKENDYALFVYNKTSLIRYDPTDNSIKNIEVSYPNSNAEIKGIVIYNRRLYSLDVFNNSIYRHDSIKNGFAQGVPWLKDNNTDLKNGVDITIDGDLFVQKSDGNIVKFNAGVTQLFNIQGLDPVLTSANEIWTYTDLNYLYILDTDNNRLILLNKDGRIKNQIMAEQFVHPDDMIIDEPNNRAYILDENKLYQINLK